MDLVHHLAAAGVELVCDLGGRIVRLDNEIRAKVLGDRRGARFNQEAGVFSRDGSRRAEAERAAPLEDLDTKGLGEEGAGTAGEDLRPNRPSVEGPGFASAGDRGAPGPAGNSREEWRAFAGLSQHRPR